MTHSFLHAEGDAPSKAAILERALELFVRDGLCETSIRDIAAATGYTNPALYKFFEGKDALALHLFERCYHHLVTQLEHAQGAEAPFDAKLAAVLATFLDVLTAHPSAVLFVQENLRTFWRKLPASARRHSVLGVLRALLEQGQRDGAVRRDLDVPIALAVMSGTFGQIARMAYFDELPRPWAAHATTLYQTFHRAFDAPTKATR